MSLFILQKDNKFCLTLVYHPPMFLFRIVVAPQGFSQLILLPGLSVCINGGGGGSVYDILGNAGNETNRA